MCGIFGVFEHDGRSIPDRNRLEESARLLEHRGPDHTAFFQEPGIGLAHTRLSLLDPDPRSHQPFWDRSRRFAIVYNGEIYNFRELRRDLERRGASFRTTSDTEVLLEAIVDFGLEEALPRFEGMYAFALYDREDRSLSLARDPFGIKPLYVFEDDRSVIFSSESRAVVPWRTFELDVLRTAGFLSDVGSFSRGHTLLKGVRMMDPGSIIQIVPGKRGKEQRFHVLTDLWDPDFQEEIRTWKPSVLVDQVESALLSAVDLQRFADAPIGALCSGGVDSSLTLAMAARVHPNISVFHAKSPGRCSELPFAHAIAEHLSLDLQIANVREQDCIDLLPETILHRSGPFVDLSSSVPFLKLSRLVRTRGVKGVLTGEGSDEIFWGFPRMVPNPIRFLKQAPGRVFRRGVGLFSRLLGLRPTTQQNDVAGFIKSLFARFELALEDHEIQQTLSSLPGGPIKPRDYQSLHELSRNLRPLLNRNDGCGMAASVESRFPFLDSKVVKLAVNLPTWRKARISPAGQNPKHRFVIDKWILRKVADRYMPKALSRRHKVPWPYQVQDRITIPEPFFADSYVRDLFGFTDRELGYLMGSGPQQLKLDLLHLEVWAQMFLNGSSVDEQVQKLQAHVSLTPIAP